MKLVLERQAADALNTQFPGLLNCQQQLSLSGKAEINPAELNAAQYQFLQTFYAESNPIKAVFCSALAQIIESGEKSPANLEELLVQLIHYLLSESTRGWLFYPDGGGSMLPYLVTRIDFSAASSEDQARIMVELKANSRGKLSTNQIILSDRDLGDGGSVAQLLLSKGYLKETPSLLAQFDDNETIYQRWRECEGEQFSALGTGIFAEDPSANRRSADWTQKTRVILSASGTPAKLVNDEGVIQQRDLTFQLPGNFLRPLEKKIDRNSPFSLATDKELTKLIEEVNQRHFDTVPIHGFILMFHLELHHHVWVHVDNLSPYAYQPELKDKLVLPNEHVELIDILTAEMELLTEDIIAGKSGGTTVLCSGPPGVGKTLTAEVYAEIIQRPLYRVHSGQLGLSVAEMENNLKEVLIRAQRWGAVMLIDEADVYIKRRDDNLTMNAVVGVFLRVLEYFNGLLFMTTNRIDDIDEAIISRCIAMIRYQSPSNDERQQIWRVMAEQYNLALDDAMIATLADTFPSTSGRDIKGLAKLVARFCQYRACLPSMAIFQHCAKFRALQTAQELATNEFAAQQ